MSALDHKRVCTGKMTCSECGRPVCRGCSNEAGKCLICSGMYKEENIILHPIPNRDWDV